MKSLLKYLTPSYYKAKKDYAQTAAKVFTRLFEVALHPNTHYIVIDPSKIASSRYNRLMLREAVRAMAKEAYAQNGIPMGYYDSHVQMTLEGWYDTLTEISSKPGQRCYASDYSTSPDYCGILTGDHALFPLCEMKEADRYALHDAVFDACNKRVRDQEPVQFSDGDVNLLLFQLQKTSAD